MLLQSEGLLQGWGNNWGFRLRCGQREHVYFEQNKNFVIKLCKMVYNQSKIIGYPLFNFVK